MRLRLLYILLLVLIIWFLLKQHNALEPLESGNIQRSLEENPPALEAEEHNT